MSVPTGSRISAYEVTGKLGAGGMGEVYRGRDTRLNRDVAIKALPPTVATDPERTARFEREAQILATLHHPNIAGIYGLEQSNGSTYLVLEFVDGRPLDAILKTDGAFAPADAVTIARQIADAMAAAHDKGIIHRDLKPANVMLGTDGRVKVLDFGLGKAIDDGRSRAGESAANSPTMTIGATQAGIVLGTAGYMSPEQAKGHAADRRSDVWSFGCLLFELLAGSRAFEGEDVTDTIAAIVRGEPNMKALPASTPPALRQLIERTLVKDRNQRLPDMSVIRYILNEPGVLSATGSGLVAAAPVTAVAATGVSASSPLPATTPVTSRAWIWMGVALLAIAPSLIWGIVSLNRRDSESAAAAAKGPVHLTVVLPDDTEVINTNQSPLAISPDGQFVAFAARHAGRIQLYVNDFSTGDTKALDGTDDAKSPFFSPDGKWIAFFAKRKLKKITVGGTSLLEVTDAPDARGGTWASNDTIYYAPTNTSGIWRVAASGGAPAQLTKPDPAASEISHRYPHALAGGSALLFMAWTGPGSDEHRIEYLTLADGKRQVVVQNAEGPIAVVGGHIVYASRQDALLSAPWDPSHPSLQGAVPQALPFFVQVDNEGAGAFAASDNGTLVRLAGGPTRRLARIVWVDRSGKTEALPLPDRDYVGVTISPDGTRAAIHNRGATEELWIYDFRTKTFTPLLTPGGSSQAPVWTTDSKYVVYRGTRQGYRDVFRKAADGSGPEERLTNTPGVIDTPTAATPDGKWILFTRSGEPTPGSTTGSGDIWKVALDGAHDAMSVIATPAAETGGQVSPDGRWIVFETNVTGRVELWARPFAKADAPALQVSRDGGTGARWSRDGREVYFVTPEGIMSALFGNDTFAIPRTLVAGRFRLPANANTNYDVTRDGRFLQVLPIEPTRAATRFEVVLNGIAK